MGSLLTFAAYAYRKKLGRSPERPLSSSFPFCSRLQRRSAFRPFWCSQIYRLDAFGSFRGTSHKGEIRTPLRLTDVEFFGVTDWVLVVVIGFLSSTDVVVLRPSYIKLTCTMPFEEPFLVRDDNSER